MPDVLAEVRRGWLAGRGSQFLDAIHAGIAEALHTPEDDKVLRLVEHPPEHFAIRDRPENGTRTSKSPCSPAGPWRPGARSTRRSSEISNRSACRRRT